MGCLQHRDEMKFLFRKRYSDTVYLEVIQIRKRNGRDEWLSRWAYSLRNQTLFTMAIAGENFVAKTSSYPHWEDAQKTFITAL